MLGVGLGAAIFGDKAFGKKPIVPTWDVIDPNKVQQDTIHSNQLAQPGAQQLAASTNSFNINQALEMTRKSLDFVPGGAGKVQDFIGSELRGEVPGDVSAQLQRSGAARGFGSGTAGSSFSRNLTLRDLGLTSLGIQRQGMSDLEGVAPKVPLADMSSMFFTPQQRLDFTFKQQDAMFNQQWLQNQVNAAPDPFASAMTQAIIHDENAILKTISSVAGMAAGAA